MRLRLALSGFLIAALAVLALALAFERLVVATAPQDLDNGLERRAAAFVRELDADVDGSKPLTTLRGLREVEQFVLVVRDGRVRASSVRIGTLADALPAELRSPPTRGVFATLPAGPDRPALRLFARPLRPGSAVVVGQAASVARRSVYEFRSVLAISVPIVLAFVAFAGWLVSGRVLRPLRRLAATSDAIARTGDLGQRLPEGGRDSLAVIAQSFNRMLARLDASQRDLAATLESQRTFLADASHELRSPLTTIRANAGFLRDRADAAPGDRDAALADIAADAARMARLVDGLLVLARADASAPLRREPVDLRLLVADVARRIGGGAVTVGGSRVGVVRGDPDELERLVVILVENALGHGAPPVEVDLEERGDGVELHVRDHGRGIDGDGDALFARFVRADSSRSHDGAGLGLAIARAIVERHGGVIAAVPADRGAHFRVVLPRDSQRSLREIPSSPH